MSLDYLKLSEIKAIVLANFKAVLPEIDPTIDSWIQSLIESDAASFISIQDRIRDLERQLFPQDCNENFLENWGSYENLSKNAATGASGIIVQEGNSGINIPFGTLYTGSNGISYQVIQTAIISEKTIQISSLTRSGTTVTAITQDDHNLGSGQTGTISGANESEYNVTTQIAVIDYNKFSYTISGSPSSPATGSISFAGTFANVNIQAKTETGLDTNIERGASLSLTSSITGITNPAIVTYDQISGGADEESNIAYRARIMLARSNVSGVFTNGQIKLAALSIAGNTRVFIENPQISTCDTSPNPPVPGQVAIYPLRDNDPSIVPSQNILNQTKQAIISQGKLPSHTSEYDVLVLAASLIVQNFVFSAIDPDNATMRSAIQKQLESFFQDYVSFATTIPERVYISAIQDSYDTISNTALKTFTLSSPTGDIVVSSGQIAVLGDVSFS